MFRQIQRLALCPNEQICTKNAGKLREGRLDGALYWVLQTQVPDIFDQADDRRPRWTAGTLECGKADSFADWALIQPDLLGGSLVDEGNFGVPIFRHVLFRKRSPGD